MLMQKRKLEDKLVTTVQLLSEVVQLKGLPGTSDVFFLHKNERTHARTHAGTHARTHIAKYFSLRFPLCLSQQAEVPNGGTSYPSSPLIIVGSRE